LAHGLQRLTLELEAGPEALVDIARSAAEAEHGVLFLRLVAAAADEIGVLVGLEVRQAHDDRRRRERRGDLRDPLGELLHVEADRARVARHLHADLLLELPVQPLELEQRPGVVPPAAGCFLAGSQPGSVMSPTSTSPFCTRAISAASRMMRATPAPMRWPTLRPVASTRERPLSA